MHTICDRTEPPGGMSACASAKLELAIASACLAARVQINKKYYGGKGKVHNAEQVEKRIKKAVDKISDVCR